MSLMILVTTIVTAPMGLFKASLEEPKDSPSQSYLQMFKQLFEPQANNSKKEEIRRHLAVQRVLLKLFEQEESERNEINLKIKEFEENVTRVHYEVMNHKKGCSTAESKEVSLEKKQEPSQFAQLYDNYLNLIKTYPVVDNFSKLTTDELEEYLERFQEHHELTIGIGAKLLEEMDFSLRNLYREFESVVPYLKKAAKPQL